MNIPWLLIGFILLLPAALGFATLWLMERSARIKEQSVNRSASRDLGTAVAALERRTATRRPVELDKMFEDAMKVMKQEYRK